MIVIVEHSKCKKCGATLHINDLKDSKEDVGKICLDSNACKDRIAKQNNK